MSYIANMTPEQRQEALSKARVMKAIKSAQRDLNKLTLKMDYLDAPHWAGLASKYKIRMPLDGEANSASNIRKYLKKANVSLDVFNEHYTGIKYFMENNPLWNAYAVAGLILELKEDV